jgi:hypothetical protein
LKPQENSQTPTNSQNLVEEQVRLLNDAIAGHLDGLLCPSCHESAVSVWFTNPRPNSYRTWFVCQNCQFHTRVQNATKPRFFGEDRVNPALEAADAEILKRAKFKKQV